MMGEWFEGLPFAGKIFVVLYCIVMPFIGSIQAI